MFVLNSEVSIGAFKFTGVHEVQINRSMHSIVETATIKIPAISSISRNGKVQAERISTASQFKEGDEVTIKLGYNDELQTEFKGFVSAICLGMPLTIACEGYSWLLRKNNIASYDKPANIKELLQMALSGIDQPYKIDVVCDAGVKLNKIIMGDESGFSIIDKIMTATDGCLSCFFIEPTTLWCGYVYSGCAKGKDVFNIGSISYRPGYNVLQDHSLKVRDTTANQVTVTYSKRTARGNVATGVSDVFPKASKKHTKVLNQVSNEAVLKEMADEKACSMNYAGYEGSLTTFLKPYAMPGYVAYIKDSKYPERDGRYLIESVKTIFGLSGARRTVEAGPKV